MNVYLFLNVYFCIYTVLIYLFIYYIDELFCIRQMSDFNETVCFRVTKPHFRHDLEFDHKSDHAHESDHDHDH